MENKSINVIGLGNLVLSDDALGLQVVRRARDLLDDLGEYVDFKENHSGGFDMLYDIIGYDRIIIVDCIVTGTCEPGTCITYSLDDFDNLKQVRPFNSHSVNLPTILEIGRKYGYHMPDEIIVLGIEVEDIATFSEKMTDKVSASIDTIVGEIREIIIKHLDRECTEVTHAKKVVGCFTNKRRNCYG